MADELSGGDVPGVLQCLQGALSTSPEVQKQAETVLVALERRPGFCSCLAEVIGCKDYDHSARWLASVQLKNSISRHWRGSAFSAAEKSHIRSKLSSLVAEDDNQIAVQVALVYAKVARMDWPRDWPALFSQLLGSSAGPAAAAPGTRRVWLVLHHVLKELSSKRLAVDQRNFAEVSAQLLPVVWSQWAADTQALLAGLPSAAPAGPAPPPHHQPLLLSFERWLLLLKVLRRLILFGCVSDAKSLQPVAAVSVCIPPMVQALQQLLALRPSLQAAANGGVGGAAAAGGRSAAGGAGSKQLAAMLDRSLLKLAKTQCQVQQTHPWSYHAAGALLPMMGFCCDQIMAHQQREREGDQQRPPLAYERYLIQCMAFLVHVVKSAPYSGITAGGDPAGEHEQDAPVKLLSRQASEALAAFWAAPERLTQLQQALVFGYLVLTAPELEEWQQDGEEFYHKGEGGGWQDNLRQAAEVLLLSLVAQFRPLLAPPLVAALQAAAAACPPGSDLASLPGPRLAAGRLGALPLPLLQLEAAYCAAAVSAYELHEHLDFTQLLRGRLLAELGSSGPLSSLLKRPVLRLVACWGARLEGSDRPPLYRAVNTCLWDTDPCLQLGAVTCLHALVDDWGFEDQQFAEFLAPCCSGLLHRVLPACKQLESHTLVFNLLNVVIERMGDLMRPHVEGLLALMPGLWAEHGGQSLVQVQILLALQRLVNVLGTESSVAYPLLLPLLQYATDPRQPDALHLLEDGLGLWLVAVRNALTPEPGLLGLLPHLALAMGQSTEHIQHACALLASLVLLGKDPFVAQFHAELNTIFVGSLGNVNERGHLLLLPVMERCLAAAPASAPQALQPALLKLLGMVLKGKESRLTVAAACCVLARLLLHSPQTLLELLAQAAAQGLTVVAKPGWAPSLTPPELLLAGLMEEWCDHSDVIAQPRQRKLSALGLCTLLTLPSAASLACLDVIVASITGVWFELEGGNDSTPGDRDAAATAKLYSGDDSGFDAELNCAAMSEDAQGETDRRIQLRDNDPVFKLRLGQQLRASLAAAEARHGAELGQGLARLDLQVATQLQAACGM